MKEPFFDFPIYDIPQLDKSSDDRTDGDKIMVIVYKEDHEAHKDLLIKIFSAVGQDLTAGSGVIVLEKGNQINIQKLSLYGTERVISFGIAPRKMGLNATFKAYQIYTTESFDLMLSHSLAQLSEEVARKKALWEALQKMFAVGETQ